MLLTSDSFMRDSSVELSPTRRETAPLLQDDDVCDFNILRSC
jgi:hypothetical protein